MIQLIFSFLRKFDQPEMSSEAQPTFYCLGNIFLENRPFLKLTFLSSMLLNFLSLLISYCLAGTQAYAGILPGEGLTKFFKPTVSTKAGTVVNELLNKAPVKGVGYVWMLLFTIILSCMILFHSQSAQFVVQVLTTGKALILAIAVFSVLLLSMNSEIVTNLTEDWSKLGSGFLMGTVALGEAAQVLPLLYCQIDKPSLYAFQELKKAVILALITCYVLGVLWCTAILNLIPQGIDAARFCNNTDMKNRVFNPQEFNEIEEYDVVCNKGIYLTQASKRGMISSNPLTQLLDSYDSLGYDWLASMIRLFVAVSITVSFLAVGSAMYHALKGWTKHLYELCIKNESINVDLIGSPFEKVEYYVLKGINPFLVRLNTDEERHRFMGAVIFGFITVVALINPKGFSNMLKYETSLSLNGFEANFCG